MENLITTDGKRQERYVGASGKNGRRRQVINVDADKLIKDVIATFGCDWDAAKATVVKDVMLMFDCDRKTAKATIERGYYIVDFHKRTTLPGPIDPESAYRLAWFIFRRKFEDRLPWYIDAQDLVQEGVVRLLEMGGHPRFQERGFQFYLALNAMKGWIERQRRMRGGIGGTTPGYEETYRRDAWSSWQTDWQVARGEAPRKAKASPDACPRSQTATEKIVRQIYEAGEGVSQAGLGRHLGISARCAGKKVAKAIQAGLAENIGCATGPRGQAIRLTAKGRTLIGAAA